MNKTTFVKNIGEIVYVKSKNARSISITVKAFQSVKVTVPNSSSFSDAETFVKTKHDWIIKSKEKIQLKEKRFTIFTEQTQFSTYMHVLRIIPEMSFVKHAKISITTKELQVYYPFGSDIKSEPIQNAIRHGIIECLKIEAKEYLPQRVEELANLHGFRFKRVSIKNAKTRWGSCSYDNNINLNIHLMRLPQHLIDYVILHELSHTVEKNHGPKFWTLLEKVCENARKKTLEVNAFSAHIY